MTNQRNLIFVITIISVVLVLNPFFVFADTGDDIQVINDEISARKVKIDQLDSQIDQYQKKIDQAEAQQLSLANEIELLNNRVAQTELEIAAANEEILATGGEIKILDNNIVEKSADLLRQQKIMASVLQQIRAADKTSVIDWVLGSNSFSTFFDHVEKLETINSELEKTLATTQNVKSELQAKRTEQENKLISLEYLQKKLEKDQRLLEEEKNSKAYLIEQTAQSEEKFLDLVDELLAEQTSINRQVTSLQSSIEDKLKAGDLAGDSSVLSWPAEPIKGISATFHDSTYPFRHLFEHPGVDIPTPAGTPVKSSAPGYVAWVKLGNLYGNYLLIIHADGVATLYAHLSKILVSTDDFVARGETVALSGGQPGTPGAGLSTGPHLHFEVRKDGIPTNPMNYLISY
jgi:murein DD-endopeptidase MepM/ murein hydrolase activator NlpD